MCYFVLLNLLLPGRVGDLSTKEGVSRKCNDMSVYFQNQPLLVDAPSWAPSCGSSLHLHRNGQLRQGGPERF